MGSEHNRLRKKWQDYSGSSALIAEKNFEETFKEYFDILGNEFEIIPKPKNFSKLYVGFPLDNKTLKEIFTPSEAITKHGLSPDYSIINHKNKKTIFIEVKRQDGWVEGKPRSAGRGNAHERSCKYFTPGLISVLRREGKISEKYLPFWTVFIGDITRDPCRVREISLWYGDHKRNYFFWRDQRNKETLISHFINNIVDIIS